VCNPTRRYHVPRTPEAAFVKKYLAPLKGATIESVGADEQDDYGTTEACQS
jgi:hypothetical protein